MNKDQFTQKYDFLKSEIYHIKTIPFDRIDDFVQELPGIYSWYIRPKPNREHEIKEILHEILQQTKLHAKLTGNIRLNYEGDLLKKVIDFELENSEMLRNLFLLVPYPLYIGISINLKQRLKVHCEKLNFFMNDNNQFFYKENYESDTEDESSCFAERIGRIFKTAKRHSIDCLFVRVYEYKIKKDINEIKKDLARAESLANSLFNPVFGRR